MDRYCPDAVVLVASPSILANDRIGIFNLSLQGNTNVCKKHRQRDRERKRKRNMKKEKREREKKREMKERNKKERRRKVREGEKLTIE